MSRYSQKNELTYRGFKSNTLNRRIIMLFVLILIVNFNHNLRVSTENTTRNFQYKSWQILTRETNLFNYVKTADIFISNNQNDAYETNAGTFYTNTGIRLAYLFNTSSIFPNILDCPLTTNCKLNGLRQKSISTIPNLTRGTFVPKRNDSKRIDDWVGKNSKPGALASSTIWAFDMFLFTPTNYFSYLVPFLEDETQAIIDFTKFKAVTITSNSKKDFGPAIANVCLVQEGEDISQSGFLVTRWKVPDQYINPSGELVRPASVLDFREIQPGTCALK
jgi:hypothetical protein